MTSLGTSEAWREELAPYFFGEDTQRLYACRHAPSPAHARAEAVVICNATGHEYERCHRATRQLAVQCARAGYPTMRFDYFGTGDSAGDGEQASLVYWRRDITRAIDESRRQSGREQVCLAGLRLGATLAAQAAADRTDVSHLVLYAPVTDAESLFAEWRREQAAFDRKHSHATANAAGEILGFPVSDALRAELARGLALRAPAATLRRVLLLVERIDDEDVRRAASVLGSAGAGVTVEQVEGPAIWRREPLEAIVPFKTLRRIVAWLGEAG